MLFLQTSLALDFKLTTPDQIPEFLHRASRFESNKHSSGSDSADTTSSKDWGRGWWHTRCTWWPSRPTSATGRSKRTSWTWCWKDKGEERLWGSSLQVLRVNWICCTFRWWLAIIVLLSREPGTRGCVAREGRNYKCKCKRGFAGRYCERGGHDSINNWLVMMAIIDL